MSEMSDLELLNALGVETKSQKQAALSPKEERVIAGFEEIQRFIEEHGRVPSHGESKDIFERIYAVRLDRIRKLHEYHELLKPVDHQNLLSEVDRVEEMKLEDMDDDALLAQLGVEASNKNDVTQLKYVKSRAEIRAAEEVASRVRCEDFETFKPLFEKVQEELKSGLRETRPFRDYAEVKKGDFFILTGHKVYIAEMGKEFLPDHGRSDCRLRVIYDNGTESDILMRSLQRALNKDEAGRRIVDKDLGPLFSGEMEEADQASGKVYVLRSKLDHPVVNKSRDVIHKIGVTGGSVEKRIANAKLDPTFLMADVEIVATYELFNINKAKLEAIIHRFFDGAKLEIQINDRFGNPVVPREWFLVPLFVIDEVVEKIKDGTISQYSYDAESARLVKFKQKNI